MNTRLPTNPGGSEKITPIGRMLAAMNTGEGLSGKRSPMGKLRDFLQSDEAKLFTRSLDRGLAELVLNAIWMELKGKPADKLHAGLEGAEYFRGLQRERVEKVSAIFRLKNERALETIKATRAAA